MKIGDLVFIQAGYDDYLRQVGVVLNVRTAALNSVVDVMCEDGVLSVEIDDLEVISEDR